MNKLRTIPIQVISVCLLMLHFMGEAMAQNNIRPSQLQPDVRVSVDKPSLKGEDAKFIEFMKNIKTEDINSFLFINLGQNYFYETENGLVKLRIDGHILTRIPYQVVFNPLATESQTTSFWKTKNKLYFFMFSGGLAVSDRLYGPFRFEGGTFVFLGKR